MVKQTVCLYDPDSRLGAVGEALSAGHFDCDVVTDERAVWDACTQGVDCLVLPDHEDRDGVALYERLGDSGDLMGTTVVVYTTQEGRVPLRRAIDSGVDDVLRVPTERADLLRRRIETAMGDGTPFESEAAQFRSLLRSYPSTLFVKDTNGRFVNLTTQTAHNYGYNREELIGMTDYELFDVAHAEELYAEEQEIIDGKRSLIDKVEHYVDDDGVDQWVNSIKVPRYDDNGAVVGVVGGTQYVTTAKRQEELITELHEASQRLARAKTSADVAVVAVAIASEIELFTHAEIALHENGALTRTAAMDDQFRIYNDQRDALEAVFDSQSAVDIEDGTVVPLGDHGVFAYQMAGTEAFDGFVERLVRVFSGTVEAELDRAERERQLTETTRRIKEFATLGSHELRNKLQVALGNLTAAHSEYDDPRIDRSLTTLNRIDRLLEQLLQLARTGSVPHEREWVDIETAAETAWESIDSQTELLSVDSTATVEANRDSLVGLFEFLLENVVDHAGENATATVGSLDTRAGFFVEDDGSGIDLEEPANLFAAEYTHQANSSGYGLYVTAAIVDAHGWSIDIEASEEGGARFEIEGVTERVEY